MKKIILYVVCTAVLLSSATAFSSCGSDSDKKDNDTPQVNTIATTESISSKEVSAEEEVETVYVVVTNEKGEKVTDENGQEVTEKVSKTKKNSKKNKTKTSSTAPTYEVKGGTDPYVEDIF